MIKTSIFFRQQLWREEAFSADYCLLVQTFFIELFGHLQKRPSCSKTNNTKKYSSKKPETIKIRDLKDTIVGCLPNQTDEFP